MYVYVLEDENGKRYKGITNNLKRRLSEHSRGKTKTTSKMRDLKVVYLEECDDFESARKRELYFKTAAGRRFLKTKIGPRSSIGYLPAGRQGTRPLRNKIICPYSSMDRTKDS